MIAVGIEEMAGSDRVPTLTIESEPQVGKAQTIYESEMALHFECTHSCVRIGLDTADIVRDRDVTTVGWMLHGTANREAIISPVDPWICRLSRSPL
jgi:hypothetical protein